MLSLIRLILSNPVEKKKLFAKYLIGKPPKFILLLSGGYLFFDGVKNGTLNQENLVFIMSLFDGASKNDFQYGIIFVILIVSVVYIIKKIKLIIDVVVDKFVDRIKKR